jgi:hypothetical protein
MLPLPEAMFTEALPYWGVSITSGTFWGVTPLRIPEPSPGVDMRN